MMLKEIKEIVVSIEQINKTHNNNKLKLILENKINIKQEKISKLLKYKTFQKKDLIYLYDLCKNIISNYKKFNKDEKEWLRYNYQFSEINLYLKHHIKNSKKYIKKKDKKLAMAIFINLLFLRNKIEYLRTEYKKKVLAKLDSLDKELILLLAKYTFINYKKKFHKYFKNDLKSFVDQFHRDHRLKGFPSYILSSTQSIISKKDYNYIICILRGGLTQTLLFELLDFSKNKIKYVKCGRIHGKHAKTENDLSFKEISSLRQIAGKKILIIDNNLFNGNTVKRVCSELNEKYKPAKISLCLDYICPGAPFEKKKLAKLFSKVYEAKTERVTLNKSELRKIKLSLIQRLKRNIN
ncbi:hypothetical protein HOE37_01220 [Candidatus Woesearchaeota archaeon]|jgi:hypoxanthine phosphoribosyltransferase|nr:hypothetical protein [Candidatus Woesearchaeota archaeon]MBT4469001.1 hypothetical protein [Candidatus Woesearchaeota archaeon]MBT6744680.1 hypothetical protein [Candidatus Woesearchaeota archaeon]